MLFNIINANIVLPDEIIANASLTVENGIIRMIGGNTSTGVTIDAAGAYLMPA